MCFKVLQYAYSHRLAIKRDYVIKTSLGLDIMSANYQLKSKETCEKVFLDIKMFLSMFYARGLLD